MDLTPELLLTAYSQGMFPWPMRMGKFTGIRLTRVPSSWTGCAPRVLYIAIAPESMR
jgi:Leu/Phe-tRNA-protein transferase